MLPTDGVRARPRGNGTGNAHGGNDGGGTPKKRSFADVGHYLNISPANFAMEPSETYRKAGIADSIYNCSVLDIRQGVEEC